MSGKPYSAAAVADWINEHGGKISAVYILKIQKGERVQVGDAYLVWLARFFCVPAEFFTENNQRPLDVPALTAEIVRRDDELLRSLLGRASRLSERSRHALSDIVDSLAAAEGRTTPADDLTHNGGEWSRLLLTRAGRLSERSRHALSDIVDSLLAAEHE